MQLRSGERDHRLQEDLGSILGGDGLVLTYTA